jgi:hypothetical protein
MVKERTDLDRSKYNDFAMTIAQLNKRAELLRRHYKDIDAPEGYETAHASNSVYMESNKGRVIAITATGDVIEPRCVREVIREPQ